MEREVSVSPKELHSSSRIKWQRERERERLTARVKERKEFGLNDNLSRGKTILEESE